MVFFKNIFVGKEVIGAGARDCVPDPLILH